MVEVYSPGGTSSGLLTRNEWEKSISAIIDAIALVVSGL
jgi:hypothetical protein